MENKKIPITKNQAQVIRQDNAEINNIMVLLRTRMDSNRRFLDLIVMDADLNPDVYADYGVTSDGDKFFLELIPKLISVPPEPA